MQAESDNDKKQPFGMLFKEVFGNVEFGDGTNRANNTYTTKTGSHMDDVPVDDR